MTGRLQPLLAVGLAATLAIALAGCGADGGPPATATVTTSAPPTEMPTSSPTPIPVTRTPELDAIGVIGHSGATGADSNGDGRDVVANSWATGDNPDVQSVYLRLLARHPALSGHHDNEAISGSDVGSLMGQAQALLSHDPVPDVVLIQSIDNDVRCDGSDEDNYGPFEQSIEELVTYLQEADPGVRLFFTSQWASVKVYDDMAATDADIVRYLSGSGLCDVFTLQGERRPEAEAYLQGVVDAYFRRIEKVCAAHPPCATDDKALQRLDLTRGDITDDYNHLSVSGQAKMAAIVWDALPAAWKS